MKIATTTGSETLSRRLAAEQRPLTRKKTVELIGTGLNGEHLRVPRGGLGRRGANKSSLPVVVSGAN